MMDNVALPRYDEGRETIRGLTPDREESKHTKQHVHLNFFGPPKLQMFRDLGSTSYRRSAYNYFATIDMLGKRKRDTRIVSRRNTEAEQYESNATLAVDSNDIFRRHFEATFTPLPESQPDQDTDGEKDDGDDSNAESEVSEWSGLSESGGDLPVVEVVNHAIAESGIDDEVHRARLKAFMVRLSRLTELRGYADGDRRPGHPAKPMLRTLLSRPDYQTTMTPQRSST